MNVEFSDPELDLDLNPLRARTRSQSQAKEIILPTELTPRPRKGRKGAKKNEGIAQKPRRRPAIQEISSDEDNQ